MIFMNNHEYFIHNEFLTPHFVNVKNDSDQKIET